MDRHELPAVSLDRRAAIWTGLLGLVAAGCGPPRAQPVDVELARRTLIQVLDHWKQGGAIEDLRKLSPEVVAQEHLWQSGNKLLDYTLSPDGRAEDANWYCEVRLTLQSPDSDAPKVKQVTYVVGTDPVLTVFHAIL